MTHAPETPAQAPRAPTRGGRLVAAPAGGGPGRGHASLSRIAADPTTAGAPGPAVGRGVVRVAGPVGVDALSLEWNARGLVALRLLRGRAAEAAARDAGAAVPAELAAPLMAYLSGAAVDPTELPVDLGGTPFQRRVWHVLRAIPRGQVRSYGDVARAVGSPRAVRAVGMANAANPVPLVVPCHRVVYAGGRLGGYSGGGPARKRRLLSLEGVSVRAGRVDPSQLPLPGA